MKKTFLFLAVGAMMGTVGAQNVELKSFNDSASYAIGRDIFRNWEQQQLGIDARIAGQALIDAANGQSRLNDQQAFPLLQRFQKEFERRQMEQEARNNPVARENIEKGEKFM